MDFYRHAEAWVSARLMTNKTVGTISRNRHEILFAVAILTVAFPLLIEDFKPDLAHLMHELEFMGATGLVVDLAHETVEVIDAGSKEAPAKGEPEPEVLNQEALELQDSIKADAELAAAAIEEETLAVEQAAEELEEKFQSAVDELTKEFEQQKLELTAKVDEMAERYSAKYPDMSEDQSREAMATFEGIKADEMQDIQTKLDTRMEELTIQYQEQSLNLVERELELEGTRDERS